MIYGVTIELRLAFDDAAKRVSKNRRDPYVVCFRGDDGARNASIGLTNTDEN